jgi:shikimate kinase
MPGAGPAAPPPAPAPAAPARPVFLIGMMGAGKTTVGRLLASALQYEFIDCDAELERRTGVRIATMFELEGEAGFREREGQLLAELTARRGVVLATGGGAVLAEGNRRNLRERGLVVFLDVSAGEIARRTRHDTVRPLLDAPDRQARIEALLEQRLPLYHDTAHLRFRSPARNPRRLVETMLAHPAPTRTLPATPPGRATAPARTRKMRRCARSKSSSPGAPTTSTSGRA